MKYLTEKDRVFIKNLSDEMNKQDNRSTGKPYTYRIQQSEKVVSLDEDQYKHLGIKINDDDYYDNMQTAFEFIENWAEDELGKVIEINSKDELEAYLEELDLDYTYYSTQFEDRVGSGHLGGANCFLTEKACESFIKANSKDLINPKSYVVHEYENAEMKQLLEIVHKLAKEL